MAEHSRHFFGDLTLPPFPFSHTGWCLDPRQQQTRLSKPGRYCIPTVVSLSSSEAQKNARHTATSRWDWDCGKGPRVNSPPPASPEGTSSRERFHFVFECWSLVQHSCFICHAYLHILCRSGFICLTRESPDQQSLLSLR